VKYLVIIPVRLYQLTISPWLPRASRSEPSCSTYMLEAVRKHGAVKGAWLGLKRLLRCAPWGGHGFDPVP
jgi:putative membrane protein insertion efficiency factor